MFFSPSTWMHFSLNCKKNGKKQQHVCAYVSPSTCSRCMFAYTRLAYPATRTGGGLGGRRSHTYGPLLRVQGCCAITKTALSITLTDRLKRGFNSYSSPRALHHRGRHPSPPRLPSLSRLLSSAPVNHPGRPGQKWPPMFPRMHPSPARHRCPAACRFREVQKRREKEPCPD